MTQAENAANNVASISEVLEYDSKKEQLLDHVLGVRLLAIDKFFYKGLRDQLVKDYGSGGLSILYEMGIGYGEMIGGLIQQQGKSKISMARNLMKRGRLLGYGRWDVPILANALAAGFFRRAVIRLRNSFFAEAVGATGSTECHFFAGTIAGTSRKLFGKDYTCIEVKCLSKGDAFCEFRVSEKQGQR